MKKFSACLAAVVLILSGCSTTSDNARPDAASPPTVTVSAPATTPPSTSTPPTHSAPHRQTPGHRDAAYLYVVRQRYPSLRSVSDRVLIGFAENACDAVDRGATFKNLVSISVRNGLSARQAGFIIGAGVAAECPENKYIFRQGT
jgi:hypothetical protein